MAIALKENKAIRGVQAIAEQPAGTRVRFLPHPTPIRDPAGLLIGGFNMLVAVGEPNRDMANREYAHTLRSLLRSNLETVISIVEEARTSCVGMDAQARLSVALERIGTLAAAQDVLLDLGMQSRIEAWDLLSTICMIARGRLSGPIDLACEASAHDLDFETAGKLALIVHEIIAHAARSEANGGAHPCIMVSLRRDEGTWPLSVRDDGAGGARQGAWGLNLVKTVARQLNGSFSIERGAGRICTVRFPDPRSLH